MYKYVFLPNTYRIYDDAFIVFDIIYLLVTILVKLFTIFYNS